MKNILIITLLLAIATSCTESSTESKNHKNETKLTPSDCVEEFNSLFIHLFVEDKYGVENVNFIEPNLLPNFYEKDEISKYCFIELRKGDNVFIIATDTLLEKNTPEHSFSEHFIYFCKKIHDYTLIDFSSNAYANLNFLSGCGIDIQQKDGHQSGFMATLNEDRLPGYWTVDSVNANSDYAHSSFEFSKQQLVLDQKDSLKIYEQEYGIYSKNDSSLLFKLLAISEQHLILSEMRDSTLMLYYLKKKTNPNKE